MAPAGIGAEVEGVHAVTAAVAAGRAIRLLVDHSRSENLGDLVKAARIAGVVVEEVDNLRDVAVTSAPQGVRLECRPISPVPLDVAVRRSSPAALVVLDHLEDPRNVGAIARSALAAGFTGLIMSGRRAAPLGAAAFKAGAGSFEHLDIVVVGSIASAVDEMRKLDVWTVGLDSDGDQPLFGMSLFTEPVAVVLGAEGSGLSRLVKERVDVVASIPVDSRVESLNASVAAALGLFEVKRVRSRES